MPKSGGHHLDRNRRQQKSSQPFDHFQSRRCQNPASPTYEAKTEPGSDTDDNGWENYREQIST